MLRSRRIASMTAVAVVLVAAFLRGRGYAESPPLNADEYDWAWTGLSLLQRHVPTGWTGLWEAYGNWQLFDWQGNEYTLVTPYLDHPPLFSLMVGGVAWIAGERVLTDVSLSVIRLVPIGLSLLVLVMAYQLAQATVGTWAARVAILLLAFSPAAITLARVTESEALLTAWLVAALLALNRLYKRPTDRRAIVLLLISCTAAALTKVPGIAVGFAAAGVLLSWWRPRLALAAALAAFAGILLFVTYGALLDVGLFRQIWSAQADRHSGFSSGYELLRGGLDDWYWGLGIVGLGVLATRGGDLARLVAWPVLAYVIVITLTANADLAGRYDWYRIPIYPLVYIGAGFLIAELARSVRRFVPKRVNAHRGSLGQSVLILVSLEAFYAAGMLDAAGTYAPL